MAKCCHASAKPKYVWPAVMALHCQALAPTRRTVKPRRPPSQPLLADFPICRELMAMLSIPSQALVMLVRARVGTSSLEAPLPSQGFAKLLFQYLALFVKT